MVDQDYHAYIQRMEVTFGHLHSKDNLLMVFIGDCWVFHGHPGSWILHLCFSDIIKKIIAVPWTSIQTKQMSCIRYIYNIGLHLFE